MQWDAWWMTDAWSPTAEQPNDMTNGTVCFCTITSSGYVDQTAGLFANLTDVHPAMDLVVCCLDEVSFTWFRAVKDERLVAISAAEVWGERFWRNLQSRMNRLEIAFATKSAAVLWALDRRVDTVILLDSDLLILTPLGDLIEAARQHDVLLIANRHPLSVWWRSNIGGLFWAGLVGFSSRRAAAEWRSLCFEQCRGLPISGLYFEQKYLDYLVSFFDTYISRDPAIHGMELASKQVWVPHEEARLPHREENPDLPRTFHAARSAARGLPLMMLKERFNERGLSLSESTFNDPGDVERKRTFVATTRTVLRARVGWLLELIAHSFSRRLPEVISLFRIVTGSSGTIRQRFAGAFAEKRRLLEELRGDVDVTDSSRIAPGEGAR